MVGNLLLSNLCHNFVASASRANSLFAAASTRRWPQYTEQGEWGLVGFGGAATGGGGVAA